MVVKVIAIDSDGEVTMDMEKAAMIREVTTDEKGEVIRSVTYFPEGSKEVPSIVTPPE